MLSVEQIKSAVEKHCRHRNDIIVVYLFGSYGRKTAGENSDVDLGLLYDPPPASDLMSQPYLLAEEIGSDLKKRVDAVVMNSAPPDLVHRVLRDSILLIEKDRSKRVQFEVKARNEYFDILPILEMYRGVRS